MFPNPKPIVWDVDDSAHSDDLHHPVPVGDEVSEDGDEGGTCAVPSVYEERKHVSPLRLHQLVS